MRLIRIFAHRNIIKFTDKEGNICRPHPEKGRPFESMEEHDEYLIQEWNKLVNPKDRVYHLGDFCMARKGLQVFNRLNGRIHLIHGNHDIHKLDDYRDFKNITHIGGMVNLPKLGWILTHCPVHPNSLEYRWTHNIHGHYHHNIVTRNPKGLEYISNIFRKSGIPDDRYINVSMEQIGCKPINIDEIKDIIGNVK